MGSWPSGAKPRTPVMRQSKTERKRKKKYGHLTKSRPQRVNSLLRTLWWSGVSRIPIRWICTGWIPSDSELCMWFQKPWVTESLFIKHRSARGVYRATAPALVDLLTSGAFERVARSYERERAITCRQRAGSYYTRPENQANDFEKVYCTCKIAKDAVRIVLYVTTF